MADLNNMIRRAKMTLQTVGLVLKYKINVYEGNAPEDAERHQNYGTASQPAEGEGLIIDVGGAVMVLSVDSIKDRPKLANWDVAVWHKEGHKIHLKKGKLIEAECDDFILKASKTVKIESPDIALTASSTTTITTPQMGFDAADMSSTGNFKVDGTMHAKQNISTDADMIASNKSFLNHKHNESIGTVTTPPV